MASLFCKAQLQQFSRQLLEDLATANVADMASFSGGGGLIQTISGCRQQRVLRLHRRGCCRRARS
jgi:hypothetical protein